MFEYATYYSCVLLSCFLSSCSLFLLLQAVNGMWVEGSMYTAASRALLRAPSLRAKPKVDLCPSKPQRERVALG